MERSNWHDLSKILYRGEDEKGTRKKKNMKKKKKDLCFLNVPEHVVYEIIINNAIVNCRTSNRAMISNI